MRRALPLVIVAALFTACGDSETTSDSTAPSDTATLPARPDKPEVDLPAELPTELVITDLVEGSGPEAAMGDSVVVHYVGVRSEDGTEFDNSYDRGEPFTVNLGEGGVIQGWEDGLVGVQKGTRRQLDIPSDLAYGDSQQGEVIQPGDALTFVVDVLAVLEASTAEDAPDVTVEGHENIDAVASTDLVEGDGTVLEDGRTGVVHFVVYRADTGERLDTTWGTPPLTFIAGPDGDLFPGILEAVAGMKVGGRRQSQIPYTQVWDGLGNEQMGLPAEVDLVLVIDLLDQY